jgi:putative Mg2+ transporter-C (MgtC) family protein
MIDASLDWWETALRLLGAAGLGGLLGLEREIDGQDAGFRTHMLLSLGAGLFGVVSVGAFDQFTTERAATNVAVDVTRIASYVAAGVGFIGGGAIIKHAGVVKGITTAASLWAAAAIGLASGLGFWDGALAATIVALIALSALQPVSTRIARHHLEKAASLLITTSGDADTIQIIAAIRGRGAPIETIHMAGPTAEGGELQVVFWPPGMGNPDELVDAVMAVEGVHSVQVAGRRLTS